MLSTHTLFEWLVGLHIATGTVGLVVVWIPIAGRKGGALHRRAGTLFVQSMIATGFTAIGISITTLSDPTGTHPHLASHAIFADPQTITNIFGWMMLYLATLTVNLAWQGWLSMRNGLDHARNRVWHNLLSQVLLTVIDQLFCTRRLGCRAHDDGHLHGGLRHGRHQSVVHLQTQPPAHRSHQGTHQVPRWRRHLGLHGLLRLWCRAADPRASAPTRTVGNTFNRGIDADYLSPARCHAPCSQKMARRAGPRVNRAPIERPRGLISRGRTS